MAFTEPLRWSVREHSAALLITELCYVEEDQQGIREWYDTSPDLRSAYGVPAEAVAVELYIKNKVICNTGSIYHCDGTLAIAVGKPNGAEALNFVSHNRQVKAAGFGGLTVEFVDYTSPKVQLTDGTFSLFTSRSIVNHVKVTRDVFLAGYGVP